MPPSAASNFFTGLFDLRFENLVTVKIVGATYLLLLLAEGLWCLLILIGAFGTNSGGIILAALIGVPLLFFVLTATWRLALEMYVILFRVLEEGSAQTKLLQQILEEQSKTR
ncbi:MAG: DUF4282 domain-containing protein [Solirubrobacterales bacterium]